LSGRVEVLDSPLAHELALLISNIGIKGRVLVGPEVLQVRLEQIGAISVVLLIAIVRALMRLVVLQVEAKSLGEALSFVRELEQDVSIFGNAFHRQREGLVWVGSGGLLRFFNL